MTSNEKRNPSRKNQRKYRKAVLNEEQILAKDRLARLAVYEILEKNEIYPIFSKREKSIINALSPYIKITISKRGRPKGDGAPIQDAILSFGIVNLHIAKNGSTKTKAFKSAGSELGRSEHTIKKHFLDTKKYLAKLGHPLTEENVLEGLTLGNMPPGSIAYWQAFLDTNYREHVLLKLQKNK